MLPHILRKYVCHLSRSFRLPVTVAVLAVSASSQALLAQPATQPTVEFRLSGEVELRSLIDYVSERTGQRIVYDEAIGQTRVNIQAPDEVPVSSLFDILQSVLKMEGLAIADTEVAGWKRIVAGAQIPEVATATQSEEELTQAGSAVPLTQVFILKNADPAEIATVIQPFLSPTGSNSVALPFQRTLIVTDVAENIRRVRSLIQLIDSTGPAAEIKFVVVSNMRAEALAEQLQELLAARARALGRAEAEATGVEVTVDPRTNQLILIGLPTHLEQAETLIKALDTQLSTRVETYTLEFAGAERLNEVIRGIIEARPVRPPYEARAEGNVLIVTTTDDVHELIRRLVLQIDTREIPESESPIRFYKIKNVPVQDLLDTLLGIEGGGSRVSPPRGRLGPRRQTTNDAAVPGPNAPVLLNPGRAQPVRVPPNPPGYVPTVETSQAVSPADRLALDLLEDRAAPAAADSYYQPGLLPGPAQVTADFNSNSLIIVAEPEVQRVYAALIEKLDQRRPQVMIEAKVVIIDTTDDFTLGVEVSGGDRIGARRLFAFSSFGLSDVDPVNGALQIIPGVGFNGTLVDPETADVVVRALTGHTRARVLSAPRILVDDNAEGELTSVAEVPFTSINASDTVATTSFAGFAEAGTTITVTPTISEDDHLQLEYTVTLNSFTGPGGTGVPPPRQTNEVRSRVTVPDGYTVIVGGLRQKNYSYTMDGIPFLENIPIIRELSSLQSTSKAESSLFVFLRPVILRDDKFRDLKFISDVDLHRAAMPPNYPTSAPLSIR